MPAKLASQKRSMCPINAFVEIFGDRWSLLIVRDLMLRGYTSYKQLQASEEGIATNILAERLDRLVVAGIIERDQDQADRRRVRYRLTGKGIDLAPVIAAAARWSFSHEPYIAPPQLVDQITEQPDAFVADVRQRWVDGATDSLLPEPAAAGRRGAPPG